MRKLESKELKGYLGTGLRIKNKTTEKELTGAYLDEIDDPLFGFDDSYKPILHPLSDLTKYCDDLRFVPIERLRELFFKTSEIENGGIYIETLVFKDNEFKIFTQDLCYTGDNNHEYHQSIGYNISICICEKLYEWHFDIHNLIPDNLAIDINIIK